MADKALAWCAHTSPMRSTPDDGSGSSGARTPTPHVPTLGAITASKPSLPFRRARQRTSGSYRATSRSSAPPAGTRLNRGFMINRGGMEAMDSHERQLLIRGDRVVRGPPVGLGELAPVLPGLPRQLVELRLHLRPLLGTQPGQLRDDFGFAHRLT